MQNNINGDYILKGYDDQFYTLDAAHNRQAEVEILFADDDADTTGVDGFERTGASDEAENEREAESVGKEDLPEGSSVKDGKIVDKDGNEIGYVEISYADVDGDGVVDKIES